MLGFDQVDLGAVFLDPGPVLKYVYWSERTKDPEGWVYKTLDDWWEETALSRFELETIRNALKKRQLVQEKREGLP